VLCTPSAARASSGEFVKEYTDRGDQMPLMGCDYHNADLHPATEPTTKRVIVLRLNQQVQVRWLPQGKWSSYQW